MGWLSEDWNEQTNNQLAGRLVELVDAVNDRRAAIDETEVAFTVADGSTETRPAVADMAGFIRGQEAIRDTLIEIQVAAKVLADLAGDKFFVTASGGDTAVVHATIITAIGLGDFTTNFNWQDGVVWERLRQYFNALIYIKFSLGFSSSSVDGSDGVISGSSAQDAWDNAIAAIHTYTPGSGGANLTAPRLEWQITDSAGLFAAIDEEVRLTYDLTQYSGAISRAELTLLSSNTEGSNFTQTWDGRTFTLVAGDAETPRITNTITTAALSTSFVIVGIKTTPTTVPFAFPGTHAYVSFIPAGGTEHTLWIDLATALADQS